MKPPPRPPKLDVGVVRELGAPNRLEAPAAPKPPAPEALLLPNSDELAPKPPAPAAEPNRPPVAAGVAGFPKSDEPPLLAPKPPAVDPNDPAPVLAPKPPAVLAPNAPVPVLAPNPP